VRRFSYQCVAPPVRARDDELDKLYGVNILQVV
jgi:hypothetical protein